MLVHDCKDGRTCSPVEYSTGELCHGSVILPAGVSVPDCYQRMRGANLVPRRHHVHSLYVDLLIMLMCYPHSRTRCHHICTCTFCDCAYATVETMIYTHAFLNLWTGTVEHRAYRTSLTRHVCADGDGWTGETSIRMPYMCSA